MLRSIRDDTVVHMSSPQPVSSLRKANGNNQETGRKATVFMNESVLRISSLITPYGETFCGLQRILYKGVF